MIMICVSRKSALAAFLIGVCAINQLRADFVLIDDFESYALGGLEGSFDIRDGGGYATAAEYGANEWINLWLLIDNDNDTFQVYAQSDVRLEQ
jgi:hypothetical protein